MVVTLGLAAALSSPVFGAGARGGEARGHSGWGALWSWVESWLGAAVCDLGPDIDPNGCPNQAGSAPEDLGPIIDPDGLWSGGAAERPAARPGGPERARR